MQMGPGGLFYDDVDCEVGLAHVYRESDMPGTLADIAFRFNEWIV